ncbi:hypothetical protein, conserved [Plasmodium gonderi]|uniref:RAP domain-containing protein n=1 Tax=Plasmodium gonderi TaxID=77519 RepID=A0A1Y1JMT1_PLAGO|nr:hypothetical protein, conserved [Plasmodium gonderi]GAW81703.1 hypothetical protein, conserved [Plasmodium gonderi]
MQTQLHVHIYTYIYTYMREKKKKKRNLHFVHVEGERHQCAYTCRFIKKNMIMVIRRFESLLCIPLRRYNQITCICKSCTKTKGRREKFFYTSCGSKGIQLKGKKYEENVQIEELKKYLHAEKINLEIFKKITDKCIEENKYNNTSVEDLLLLLILFTKHYPNFKHTFGDEYYVEICNKILTSVKLKVHYLYTSKMLIHTMNILLNLKLIDNVILHAYINKCSYFFKNEEYEIEDLVHFLSIFSKIHILKNEPKFKNLINLNWILLKSICNKLTHNFDQFFLFYKDYTYTYKLKKEINNQIKNIQNGGTLNRGAHFKCHTQTDPRQDNTFNSSDQLHRYNTIHNIPFSKQTRICCAENREFTIKKNMRLERNDTFSTPHMRNTPHECSSNAEIDAFSENINIPNLIMRMDKSATTTSQYDIPKEEQNKISNEISQVSPPEDHPQYYLLETLLSICNSLRDLKFAHIPLLNEVANKLKRNFLDSVQQGEEEKCDYEENRKSCNILKKTIHGKKIFYIMQCYLYLQVDHHMLYKSILNTYKHVLPTLNNLVILFFLLSKNKIFPSKTIDMFDSVFTRKINQGLYDEKNLIILLDSYAMHKYRNASVIKLILLRVLKKCTFCKYNEGDHFSQVQSKHHLKHKEIYHNVSCTDDRGCVFYFDETSRSKREYSSFHSESDKSCFYSERDSNCFNSNLCSRTVDFPGRVKIFHSLFKLDIYEEEFISEMCREIINEDNINSLGYRELSKLLLNMCYFSIENVDAYNLIIKNLIKYDIILDNIYLTQLKICELALRTRHVPNVYNELDTECIEYMNYIKNKEKEAQYHIKSDLQKEIKNILLTFNVCMSEEVPLGPYDVDFVQEDEKNSHETHNYILRRNGNISTSQVDINRCYSKFDEEHASHSDEHGAASREVEDSVFLRENRKHQSCSENQKRNKLIIEVNGENHFYKNTKSYTALSKLKHKLLRDLGYTVINIPYFEWGLLRTNLDKKAYIKKLISNNLNFEVINILPLNQKNEPLAKHEMSKVASTIQRCKSKTQFLTNIAKLRTKNKLTFLKRKIKNV